VKAGEPVLSVPRANNLAVSEFMNIDGHDVHGPILRRQADEVASLPDNGAMRLSSILKITLRPQAVENKGKIVWLGDRDSNTQTPVGLDGFRRLVVVA